MNTVLKVDLNVKIITFKIVYFDILMSKYTCRCDWVFEPIVNTKIEA